MFNINVNSYLFLLSREFTLIYSEPSVISVIIFLSQSNNDFGFNFSARLRFSNRNFNCSQISISKKNEILLFYTKLHEKHLLILDSIPL